MRIGFWTSQVRAETWDTSRRMMRLHAGKDQAGDALCTGPHKDVGAGIERRAGRAHVIYQDHVTLCDQFGGLARKCVR